MHRYPVARSAWLQARLAILAWLSGDPVAGRLLRLAGGDLVRAWRGR